MASRFYFWHDSWYLPGYLFVAVGYGRKGKIIFHLYFLHAVTIRISPRHHQKQKQKNNRSWNLYSAPSGPSNESKIKRKLSQGPRSRGAGGAMPPSPPNIFKIIKS